MCLSSGVSQLPRPLLGVLRRADRLHADRRLKVVVTQKNIIFSSCTHIFSSSPNDLEKKVPVFFF